MRTNNGKVRNTIISLYFILIVLAIVMLFLYRSLLEVFPGLTITILGIFLFFVVLLAITHHVSKYFEYDSDGLKIVVINRGLLISEYLNYREHKIEFEKENLLGYRFYNYFFFKTLVLTIRNRSGGKDREFFNVTLVSRRKRKYIRQSLSKIIKQNKKSNKRE